MNNTEKPSAKIVWGQAARNSSLSDNLLYNAFKKTTALAVDELKPLKMVRQGRTFQRTADLSAGIYNDSLSIILVKYAPEGSGRTENSLTAECADGVGVVGVRFVLLRHYRVLFTI